MVLSFVLVFSSLNFGAISASAEEPSSSGTYFNLTDKVAPGIETLSEEQLEIIDQFIAFENNKFVITDTTALIQKIKLSTFKIVRVHLLEKNEELALFSTEQLEEGEVTDNYIEFTDNTVSAAARKTSGVTRLRTYWWGYRLYLSDNVANTTAQFLAGGAGTSAIVGLWAPLLSVPTAIIRALAGTFAIVLGGSSGIIYKTNKGKGIYLRFTGRYPVGTYYTGMFAQ